MNKITRVVLFLLLSYCVITFSQLSCIDKLFVLFLSRILCMFWNRYYLYYIMITPVLLDATFQNKRTIIYKMIYCFYLNLFDKRKISTCHSEQNFQKVWSTRSPTSWSHDPVPPLPFGALKHSLWCASPRGWGATCREVSPPSRWWRCTRVHGVWDVGMTRVGRPAHHRRRRRRRDVTVAPMGLQPRRASSTTALVAGYNDRDNV